MSGGAASPSSAFHHLQLVKNDAEMEAMNEDGEFPNFKTETLESPEEESSTSTIQPDVSKVDASRDSGNDSKCTSSSLLDEEDTAFGRFIHTLYRSVEEGTLETLQEVIYTNSFDVNVCFCNAQTYVKRKHFGWTALHLAAAHANVDVAKYLVAQGADVLATTPGGETALHIAAKHGAADVVSFLLDCNIFLRDVQNSKGVTPLLKAVFNIQHAFKGNYRRCVDLLLGAGSNPNLSSPSKVTALHIAVAKRDTVLVTNLLAHGANVNALCCQGSSSLLRAVISPVVNTQIVSELLEAGANPSLQVNGRSLLHIAVSRCDETIVEAFLRKGADPNCKDSLGLTPLSIAVEENNIKIVPILVEGGGDINYMHLPQSISLLSKAVKNNSLRMVQLLLHLGASPSSETIMWSTPLHLAVDEQRIAIIKELLRANCPLNTTSNAKWSLKPMTPIQLAMEHCNMPIVKLLAQAGCTIQPSWLRPDRLPPALSKNPGAVQQLHELVTCIPPLLHLCRLKIRESSGDRFGQLLAYLKAESIIPTKIMSYLALSDILDG
ncbi:ankyrin [Plakobranchus ocellatus]|uniref:Ankyrin n=1 Tax=Plakobranchus ocellatus TaxID=259542 RepID=A0AAV4CGZ9_9GAST|nr:ankyrin [Plakobranchus ocellatus]